MSFSPNILRGVRGIGGNFEGFFIWQEGHDHVESIDRVCCRFGSRADKRFPEEMARNMEERLWVIAFDKATGKMAEFTSCPKNNAAFYRETYLLKGYDAGVYTWDEVEKLKGEGKLD